MIWEKKDIFKISQNNPVSLSFKNTKKKETLETEINLTVTSRIF